MTSLFTQVNLLHTEFSQYLEPITEAKAQPSSISQQRWADEDEDEDHYVEDGVVEDWGNEEWTGTAEEWGETTYDDNYDASGFIGVDQNFPEEAREYLNRMTSGNPRIPRKHAKPHTKKLYVERTCKECNAVLFKFEPSAMKQDRYFKLKELIAVHKHKYTVHEVEKSLFSLVDIAAQFAKLYNKRY